MIGKYFLFLATIGAAAAVTQVPVAIYYETLCADSMKFFTEQFTPTWKDLKAYISLQLIPYGKSKTFPSPGPGQPMFDCHHGANECHGNKFQSCLLSAAYNNNLDDKIAFIDCLMKDATKDIVYNQTAVACQSRVPAIDVRVIDMCATTAEGDRLLSANGEKTRLVQNGDLTSVPTIVFNNMFNAEDSKAAEKSFRGAVCKRITDTKPKACEGSGAPITTVGLITLLTAGLFVRLL